MGWNLHEYEVRIVLTGRIVAETSEEAMNQANYSPGDLTVHEVEVERIRDIKP